ncbi:molybdenum cofactor biosynthesis F family protein [Pseudalkalibacillus decolorationis]|uniref:molybdenum cofactor biosynthesis F family protein n=1 Tax=Pseudalkalibacillus decolorationis TaxID=163879 RepID=UPI002148F706|nr:molybdenum cofactor biosynthesis F family protein [Pseudalkalibacillus decolorationis]
MNAKEKDFISVGELSVGFSENMMEPIDKLVGKEFSLYYEDNKKCKISFMDIEALKWLIENGGVEEKFTCTYTAVMPREDIYFIDFIVSYGDTKSISIVLDLRQKIATVITSVLPTEEETSTPMLQRAERGMPLTAVNASFEHVSIDNPMTNLTPQHEKTKDLIGKTIEFVYSAKDVYEHNYLNENHYTWHCTAGNEEGLCDSDRCYYYKLDNNLYLFVWLEKVIPTAGIVIEDLDAMRSYGKIYGYEGYSIGRVSNFPVGSYAKILNSKEQSMEP